MKRLVSALLIAVLSVSLAACGNRDADNDTNNTANSNNSIAESEITGSEIAGSGAADTQTDAAGTNGDTVGAILSADFAEQVNANENASALDIADALLTNEVIAFEGATMAVEPGLLNGFGNEEITGFSEGAMFGPMIGSIPFVGYIFTLEEGTDAETFMSDLKAKGDLRWNICTEADEMVVESAGNKVFFVMCPTSLDEDM